MACGRAMHRRGDEPRADPAHLRAGLAPSAAALMIRRRLPLPRLAPPPRPRPGLLVLVSAPPGAWSRPSGVAGVRWDAPGAPARSRRLRAAALPVPWGGRPMRLRLVRLWGWWVAPPRAPPVASRAGLGTRGPVARRPLPPGRPPAPRGKAAPLPRPSGLGLACRGSPAPPAPCGPLRRVLLRVRTPPPAGTPRGRALARRQRCRPLWSSAPSEAWVRAARRASPTGPPVGRLGRLGFVGPSRRPPLVLRGPDWGPPPTLPASGVLVPPPWRDPLARRIVPRGPVLVPSPDSAPRMP